MGNTLTCDVHDEAFPKNLIDPRTTKSAKLYLERTDKIEGQEVTMSLFIGDSNDEGALTCHKCMMDTIIRRLEGLGIPFSWKIIKWNQVTRVSKNGKEYTKNEKSVYTADEYKELLKAQKEAEKVNKGT